MDVRREGVMKGIIVAGIILAFFFINRKLFFMSLFIFLNYVTLAFKLKYGFDFPIEVISLGTFMCGYIYGPMEGMIIAASSFVNLGLTGRLSVHKTVNNLLLVIIGLFAHLFSHVPIAYAGIGFLLVRYLLDTIFNLVMLSNVDYFRKIPKRAFNVLFYIYLYLGFGQAIAAIMA
ncbi:MAG: hypothetical protein NDI94_03510 [Candidatus Woesearchaeota archaeon]|nr:hypothetical protein [Candidatus Woesearchaeota archaeon]